jgi:hypothetical protein
MMQRKPPSRGEENNLAHVLIKYHVKPSAHEDFLDAWNKVEKATGACMWTVSTNPWRGMASGLAVKG